MMIVVLMKVNGWLKMDGILPNRHLLNLPWTWYNQNST